MNLTGWVQNLENANVEAIIEGPEREIGEMLDWLKTGPSIAHVEDIDVEEEEPEGPEDKGQKKPL